MLFNLKNSSLIFLVFFFCKVNSQTQDSGRVAKDSSQLAKEIKKENYHAPRRATIYSALLPGLGQAYNKKYWKIPIIYAGLAGFGYMFSVNNDEYNYYRENLIAVNDEDPNTTNETTYSSDQLQTLKNQYKKNRDLAIIGFALIYFLNIMDANVDAHLKTFDVNNDLSLHLDPWQSMYIYNNGYKVACGVSLTLNFK